MAVIHNLQRRDLVVKLDLGKLRLFRDVVTDIDRRLSFPERARLIFLAERSPARRTGGAGVAPLLTCIGAKQRGTNRQRSDYTGLRRDFVARPRFLTPAARLAKPYCRKSAFVARIPLEARFRSS